MGTGTGVPRIELDERAELVAGLPDRLLELGEAEALQRFFDSTNTRRLRLVLWVFAGTLAVYSIVGFAEGSTFRGVLAGLIVVGNLLVLRFRHARVVERNIRQVCAGVLIGHLVLLQLFHGDASSAVALWYTLIPMAAVRFRFTGGETFGLFGALYAVVALRIIGEGVLLREGFRAVAIVSLGFLYLACLAVAWGLSRRHERRFLVRWQAESGRHRERLRMKQELEYAREIQLSMLPRKVPQPGWLDVAALSLPATEVGGDYYDYFQLGSRRLAIVVGDVTGHGVASGLVLSGVRSCLNLLCDDMGAPGQVLNRVNAMLKKTSAPRMLMTLAVAVLDGGGKALTVATAGHPPVLVYRPSDGEIIEVGQGSFPLGALAGVEYSEQQVEIADGDVLLLYSDGVVETIDASGGQYGWDRLRRVLAGVGAGDSAREIRDTLLRDLWTFKGDEEQIDDVTMVVIRVTDAHPELQPGSGE